MCAISVTVADFYCWVQFLVKLFKKSISSFGLGPEKSATVMPYAAATNHNARLVKIKDFTTPEA
jgi:hypothetical protein